MNSKGLTFGCLFLNRIWRCGPCKLHVSTLAVEKNWFQGRVDEIVLSVYIFSIFHVNKWKALAFSPIFRTSLCFLLDKSFWLFSAYCHFLFCCCSSLYLSLSWSECSYPCSCFCVFQIGHVTKSGDIAGPRVLEHIVDVVLYIEVGILLYFLFLDSC